ncbi:hypothetical protein [Metapseudomonas otitidis]|uniref:hypothetical protein n=1 Tax=Metapseudomonas otitidis TaxID=319939 RepID=UPI0015FF3EBD|nr:hypothetical protein [Pseudomonas otitidis]
MLHLVIPRPKSGVACSSATSAAVRPVCNVLTADLAKSLQALNSLSRCLRAAGIQVEAEVVLDTTLLIAATSSSRFAELFQKEWHSALKTSKGRQNLNSVVLRGVRVVWLTPAREVQP